MTRDLRALADTQFDLLVVGAGIYGATLAWDAAQRGLAVALIDRGDFGGGTSANSLKTVPCTVNQSLRIEDTSNR